MGVSVAATALIARHWGAGQVAKVELVTWTTLFLSIALAVIFSILVLLTPEGIAGLFGLDPVTTASAAGFIFWLGVFNIFSAINMMLGTALRAIGDVITSLCYLFFSSVLNVLFAYSLAFGIGPLFVFGVAGVALGGSFGALLVTAVFMVQWWRGRYALKVIKQRAIDWMSARQLVSIGVPVVLEQGIV